MFAKKTTFTPNHKRDSDQTYTKLEDKVVKTNEKAAKRKSVSSESDNEDETPVKIGKVKEIDSAEKAIKRRLSEPTNQLGNSNKGLTPQQSSVDPKAPTIKKVPKGHQCTYCHRVFATKNLAQLHVFRNHSNTQNKPEKESTSEGVGADENEDEGPSSVKKARISGGRPPSEKWTKMENGQFKCNKCQKLYKSYQSVRNHYGQTHRPEERKLESEAETSVLNTPETKSVQEPQNEKLNDKSEIADKVPTDQIVQVDRLHQCKPCGKKFKSKSMASAHYVKRHTSSNSEITKQDIPKENYDDVIKNQASDKCTKVGDHFKCKLCGQYYANKEFFNTHYAKKHLYHGQKTIESSDPKQATRDDLNGNEGSKTGKGPIRCGHQLIFFKLLFAENYPFAWRAN